jgi:ribosomal protein S4E
MTRAYFNDPADYNIVDEMAATIHYETEKVHTIEIPESSLEKIIDFEDQVFNHMKTGNHFNLFETLMEQKHREKMLREAYPALQKAYENYSLMLKLAESGEM